MFEDSRSLSQLTRAIRHALRYHVRFEELGDDMTTFMGHDPAGNLLEVGIGWQTPEGPAVVHAMKARPQYREKI